MLLLSEIHFVNLWRSLRWWSWRKFVFRVGRLIGLVEAMKRPATPDAQEAEAREPRAILLDAIRKQNRRLGWTEEPTVHIVRRPCVIGKGDDRFNHCKTDRIYVCDRCGHEVRYSSQKRKTGLRAEGEFQGSYLDQRWKDIIPQKSLTTAYLEGSIDCTWHWTLFCRAPVTGLKHR